LSLQLLWHIWIGMTGPDLDRWHMARAIELAARGQGAVEPNPMVGCVVAEGAEIIGEGWHRGYGGPHAEVEALAVAGRRARGATLYVTLEPCCHHGKTPPCTDAVLAAGIRRVVVAAADPFPAVAGQGLKTLQQAGVAVEVGLLEAEARRLNAPYLKRLTTDRPWIIAKWAMTLDGKIASHTGDSRWISAPQSRAIVHQLRGRVDAIVVGRRTAEVDDPLLTARPAGPRTATRVVVDSHGKLSGASQLVKTARQTPLVIAAGEQITAADRDRLEAAGCEVLICPGQTHAQRLDALLSELGRRRLTNVLVEGGGELLGSLLDARAIDEVHVFVAPKLLGGSTAPTPIAGRGREKIADAIACADANWRVLDGDLYLHAWLNNAAAAPLQDGAARTPDR
jgi:diaminohydroxyphosphoribosylaminopyrimidine deaminase/5-amino-6-(5-phosphoribosylamino)uracil reductase